MLVHISHVRPYRRRVQSVIFLTLSMTMTEWSYRAAVKKVRVPKGAVEILVSDLVK